MEVTQKHSRAACQFGEGWGYERDHIWVDHGCRASFAIQYARYGDQPKLIRVCESDGEKKVCSVNVGGGRVELARQFSKAACQFGVSWGYEHDHVWADDGCRGEFGIYR